MKTKSKNNSRSLTTWSNEPKYTDLKADYDAASDAQELVRDNLTRWELYGEGGKPIKAKPGKSTARPKLIRKNREWKYPALEDPFLNTENMFEVRPRTFEDVKAAKENGMILNYQWSTKVGKTKLVNDIVRSVVDEGTVVVKTGWKVEEETVMETQLQEQPVYASPEESVMLIQQQIASGQISQEEASAIMEAGEPMVIGTEEVEVEVEVTKLVKNHPTYEVCNLANVIIDPTCDGDMEEAQFTIHEYSTNFAELKAEEYIKDPDTGEVSGVYKNLDDIRVRETDSEWDDHISDVSNNFIFNDKPRQKLRAYEYWGYWDINGDDTLVSIVATWVNGIIIRMEENPFPHKRIPFSVATYMPIRKQVHGEPDAELLFDNQEGLGKLTRAAHDITSTQAVGQEFIDEQFFSSPSAKNQYEKGNTVFYKTGMDPKRSIYKSSVEPVSNSLFTMMEYYNADSESLSGTKAFTGGISGKAMGDSVGNAKSALDATGKRELSILRRLSDMLFKDLARLTIPMNQMYLPEETIIRITNEEFATIRKEDIVGEFDLIVDVSTPEKDQATAEKLNMLLQTNAASMDPGEARLIRAKLAKLWKQPDLERQITEFQPEPDPLAERAKAAEIRKLELENLKLEKEIEEMDSRIIERVSRAEENEYDRINKTAQAKEREARAELYTEQADQLAAQFVSDATGETRRNHELDKEFDMVNKKEMEDSKRMGKMDEIAMTNAMNAAGNNNG